MLYPLETKGLTSWLLEVYFFLFNYSKFLLAIKLSKNFHINIS